MTREDDRLFLATVDPETRKRLVRERVRAMQGELPAAIQALNQSIELAATGPDPDVVALGLLKAELFHLNRDESAALDTIKTVVLPHKEKLPEAVQFMVEGNLVSVQLANLSRNAADTFYHLVDRRRQAGYEWTDAHDLMEAQEAIDRGRMAEAVAPLWRGLVRGYHQGYWAISRSAEARFAKLCLGLGELEKAAYHTVIGDEDSQIPALAEAIITRRDTELVRGVVRRLLLAANLRKHFVQAAELVATIHDMVPDDLIPDVARWLLSRCAEEGDNHGGSSTVRPAWRAMKAIADRMGSDLAIEAVAIATNHLAWNASPLPGRVIVDREEIVDAVTRLCHRIPAESIAALADQTLPLALTRVQNSDYPNAVNLLAILAERGGPGVKQKIANAMYPPGQPVNRILAQLDQFFEMSALTDEQLIGFAGRVSGEIRLQVQHVKPGEQPVQLPETLMTYNAGEGGPIVTIGQGMGLAALSRHRDRLPLEVIRDLIGAMLFALRDSDNIPRNRETLLSQLMDFEDRADPALRAEIFDTVAAMVAPTSSPPQTHAQRAFSGVHGDQETVRAMALVCAAVYSTGNQLNTSKVGEMIEEAAVDPDPKLRRGAYAAARRLPDLPPDAILPLLMGLRDPEPATAVTAFSAFAERPEWKLVRNNWKLFLLAARSAADSPNAKLRWHASLAVRRRADSVPTGLKRECAALVTRFQSDPSASVRAISQHPGRAETGSAGDP